jgi:glycosyltransferase involved in cell wall biosynthesis
MIEASVCYILSYYSPNYIRTRTLVDALQSIDGIKLYQARNSFRGFLRYFQTIWKLITVRVLHNPDLYILGFRGYELFWVVRLITLGKPLIFDHMMSPYDSLVNETKRIGKHSLIAKLIYHYEKNILLACDLLLTDTGLHKHYFQELFRLDSQKIKVIPVGADEGLFFPTETPLINPKSTLFEVLYYGSFLPLHGMDIILKAALALLDYPIHFTLIGGNRLDLSNFHREIVEHNINNVNHISWVAFKDLPTYVARADLGLGGPFGNTGQALRVITGKTFQFLAMAKPVIIGEINEDCGFKDEVNCLMIPQGDEKLLAQAILWAFHNQSKLGCIGQRGYDLYYERYSAKQISDIMKEGIFYEILSP